MARGPKGPLEQALRATPFLDSVPPEAVKELAETAIVRDYRKGTYLFLQHDEAPNVFFLLDGRVEITSNSATGARQLHTTLEPPQLFGELGVLGGMRRTTTAVALEDTSAATISGDTFMEFIGRHPDASRSLLRALARQIAAHEVLIEDLLFLDLKGRVAKRLLGLVAHTMEDLPADGAVVPSDVTHADLASLSGGSRENVTRILSDFQRRELIRKSGRRYVLTNIDGLRHLAGL